MGKKRAYLPANIRHSQHNRLLLLRLTERTRRPADDDRVDAVRAHREDETRNIPARGVERACCNHESDHGYEKPDGNMPCALMHAARTPAREDPRRASEEERRAREDQGNGAVEAEGAYDTAIVQLPFIFLKPLFCRLTWGKTS